MKVNEAINDSRNSEISLIATLQSDAKHPRVHIDSFHSEKGHKLKKIAICPPLPKKETRAQKAPACTEACASARRWNTTEVRPPASVATPPHDRCAVAPHPRRAATRAAPMMC